MEILSNEIWQGGIAGGYYDNCGAKIWAQIHNLWTKTNWNLFLSRLNRQAPSILFTTVMATTLYCSVRLYSVPALHSVSLFKFFLNSLKSFFSYDISFALLILILSLPRCSTRTPWFLVSEFWICCQILGLFWTFHTHTAMLNAHPTIFCLGLLSIRGKNIL